MSYLSETLQIILGLFFLLVVLCAFALWRPPFGRSLFDEALRLWHSYHSRRKERQEQERVRNEYKQKLNKKQWEK